MSFDLGDTVKYNFLVEEYEPSTNWPANIANVITRIGGDKDDLIYLVKNHYFVHYHENELKRARALLIERQ